MYRQGAASDPELQQDWDDILARRHQTIGQIVRAMPQYGLRPGLSHGTVTDTLWTLASPDVYLLLTTARGYHAEQFETWLRLALIAALCA